MGFGLPAAALCLVPPAAAAWLAAVMPLAAMAWLAAVMPLAAGFGLLIAAIRSGWLAAVTLPAAVFGYAARTCAAPGYAVRTFQSPTTPGYAVWLLVPYSNVYL